MTESSLRVIARIKALPDKVDEVREVLRGLITPTRAEAGCVSYELLQNREDPTDFTFVEEWRSDAALTEHFQTEHLQSASARIQSLVSEEPDIRTYSAVS